MWEKKDIESGRLYTADIGALRLYLQLEKGELHIASEYDNEERVFKGLHSTRRQKKHDDLKWLRSVISKNIQGIRFVPRMPDNPVVVRPKYEIKIPSSSEVLFFVNIPIWIQVSAYGNGGEEKHHIELPSVILSKTWFGDTLSGELCYSAKTRALREEADPGVSPYMVTCPLRVRNSSEDVLDFERICLHVEYMTIYSGGTRLWSNTVQVNYRGTEQVSQITFSPDVPQFDRACRKLSDSRQTSSLNIVKRSFYILKNITGF